MNPTDTKSIKEFNSSNYADWEITKKIQEEGWFLIAVRVERADPKESENLIYTLGHKDKLNIL